jgi:hypothetical protein
MLAERCALFGQKINPILDGIGHRMSGSRMAPTPGPFVAADAQFRHLRFEVCTTIGLLP